MMKRDVNSFDRDREFGVILEGLHTKFNVFAEGQSAMKNKLDLLYNEFGRQKEEIFIIKTDVRVLKTDMKVVKADVAVLKTDVAVLKTDVADIKSTLGSHENRFARLESNKS